MSSASALVAVSYWPEDQIQAATVAPRSPVAGASATAFNRRTLAFFSADYAIQRTWDFARSVEISRIGRAVEQIQLVFRFDHRLVAARDVLVLESGEDFAGVESSELSIDGTRGVAKFALDSKRWQQHRLRFNSPFRAQPLYPNDNLDAVQIPTVEVTLADSDGGSQTLTRALATEVERMVKPWGAEIAPAWGVVSRTSDGEAYYRAPSAILLSSTGPNPTPAGLQLELRVAEAVAGTPAVQSYEDGPERLQTDLVMPSSTTDGAIRSITFVLTETLPPGAQRTISLAWPEHTAEISGSSPPRAVVRIIATNDENAPRRGPEGAESVVDVAAAPGVTKRDLAKKGG